MSGLTSVGTPAGVRTRARVDHLRKQPGTACA